MRVASRQLVQRLVKLGYDLESLFMITLNEYWYGCILSIYEMTDLIEKYGFLVEADVSPGTTFTYEINLVPTPKCCICPRFIVSADLGPYVKFTNLVNEPPVDVPELWQNKYAARNLPCPTDLPYSLHHGYDYVKFPKRKVKVQFTNTHPANTAYCVFYADYLEISYDYGKALLEYVYKPIVDRLRELMFPPVMR